MPAAPAALATSTEPVMLTMLVDLQTRVRQLEERVRMLEARPAAATASTPSAPAPITSSTAHAADEKRRILAALEKTGWNKLRSAKLVGLPRRTFYRRLEEYGIE